MQCADVAERLLIDDLRSDPELDQHVADCPRCTHTARKIAHLDAVLGSALVVAPPTDAKVGKRRFAWRS